MRRRRRRRNRRQFSFGEILIFVTGLNCPFRYKYAKKLGFSPLT
jgi:hypothetical protein